MTEDPEWLVEFTFAVIPDAKELAVFRKRMAATPERLVCPSAKGVVVGGWVRAKGFEEAVKVFSEELAQTMGGGYMSVVSAFQARKAEDL